MHLIDKNDYFFPVIMGESKSHGFGLKSLLGTAFSINNKIFVTAGHCLSEMENKQIAIGKQIDSGYSANLVKRYEIIEDYDIGILELAKPLNTKSICWNENRIHDGTLVSTSGFAYGLDLEFEALFNRSFTGYIVSSKRNFRFKNESVKSYELSFICPRGLSGAPITDENKGVIVGIVQGNCSMEIEIGKYEEIHETENKKTIYTNIETTKLGEAIQVSSILDCNSELLEMTIRDFLIQENKLISV